jgi:hypothetical protein
LISLIIGYNLVMDFRDWIKEIISDWEKTGRSENQLAVELGVSQPTLNAYKNGTRPRPTSRAIQDKFIAYFKDKDPRVYDALGVINPDQLHKIPEPARSAIRETLDEIQGREIPEDSDEALKITIAIFEKYGFKYKGEGKNR